MKFSITLVTMHGKYRRWMLSYRPKGAKRVRRYFKTRREAEKEQKTQLGLLKKLGEFWLRMTVDERNELAQAILEARRCGFTLRQAVESYQRLHPSARF